MVQQKESKTIHPEYLSYMKLSQHTVCLYGDLESRLRRSLVGAIKGELGITPKEYNAKKKTAEDRRAHNRQQIRSYYNTLEREIEAALFGVPTKEGFLVDLKTAFQVDKRGWLKGFTSYQFGINPSAVSSQGKIASIKKQRSIAIVGSMAKQYLERMVQDSSKEFSLRTSYYAEPKDAPPSVQSAITTEGGLLICGGFYPLITKRRTKEGLAFRNQKDLRNAIMAELAPQYTFVDDSWTCSFVDVVRIERSINTTMDWSVAKPETARELDRKLRIARDSIEQAYSHLPTTKDFASLVSRIESIRSTSEDIEKEYKDAKAKWKKAATLRSKNAPLSFSMQEESIRDIKECGRRVETDVLTELEDALKSDARASKLAPIREALDKAAYAIDWVQRIVFLAGGLMAAFPKPV
jgi:hypothetical protein